MFAVKRYRCCSPAKHPPRELWLLLLMAASCVSVSAPQAAATAWTVVGLHPSTALESFARCVDDNTQGGWTNTPYRGAIWAGTSSSVAFVSTSSAVVHALYGGDKAGWVASRAALWRGATNEYTDLHPWGAETSFVFGMFGSTQAGETSWGVGSGQHVGYHATLWTGSADSWQDLSPVGSSDSHLAAIDASGEAGRFRASVSSPYHAALWHGTAQSVVDLHPSGAYASQAQAISNGRQGGYVQFVRDGPSHAALWSGTAESFFDLTPSGGPTVAGAIYGMDGDVQVGQAGFLDGSGGATVWFGTPESAFFLGSLLSADYTETWAYAVDVDEFGTIRVVGSAYNNNYYLPNGTHYPRYEAMMWVLVPEPSSLAALAAGLAGLAGVRPRRRR